MPANPSCAGCLRGNKCPASGGPSPGTRLPLTMKPTPTPVPTVTYATSPRPRAAPTRASAQAAAFTSVSTAVLTPNAVSIAFGMSADDQPGLGVVVMLPYVGEPGFRSTGPKLAIPTA